MCVDRPIDCPCPFSSAQMKCVLPDEEAYVCISQPTNEDGPDCEYVLNAYKGNI